MKTNDEIRRGNLEIAKKRAGSAAKLADLIPTAPAYLSQIKNQTPDSKTGKPKTMGDDMARRIELAIGESSGWMDVEHVDTAITPQASETPQAADRPADAYPTHMQWVSDAEDHLLTLYRCTDDIGRERLIRIAERLPKMLLAGIAHNKA